MDDNDEIIETWYGGIRLWMPLWQDFAIGVETYGHGVRVNDDTTQWGTKVDSWLEMGLEELDDLAIYVTAQYLREKESLTDDSRHLYDEAYREHGTTSP